jgi:hypothetical protein
MLFSTVNAEQSNRAAFNVGRKKIRQYFKVTNFKRVGLAI